MRTLQPILRFGKRAYAAALFAASLLSLASAASLAKDDAPMPVTIDQLIQSPDKYANKTVRVEGQIDNCEYDSCNLCSADATEVTANLGNCVGIKFDGYSEDTAGLRTSRAMERVFRFATVLMDAKFDPTCIANYQPHEIAKKAKFICLDRVTVLTNARVDKVLSRKSALDGIVNFYRYGKLITPPNDDRKAMLAELARWYDAGALTKFVLFLIARQGEPMSSTAEAGGLACICVEQSCEGRWPTQWFAGFQSAANPFACEKLYKFKDGWRVAPEDF